MSTKPIYLGREKAIPGVTWLASGKVRDIYAVDAEHLLFVTSDRMSAFDVIMNEGVPFKGEVLTLLAAHWFEKTRDIVPNHLVSTSIEDVDGLTPEWRERLRGRVMLVRRAQPTPVEWVVRGYLAGSGLKEYQRTKTVCGIPLPDGLVLASKLPQPILTPTTKEDSHDLPLTPAEARAKVGDALYESAERAALALFARASENLAKQGILLADTKFEFGLRQGKLLLIDEALTPDSSRFWPAASWKPGSNPPSYDKQYLRDWLETLDWNKQYPPPTLAPAVIARTVEKYLEICRKVTGRLPEGASLQMS
ncbi:MAG: phosphoribosylaminoimidazolesuccinocarboxamide synthase [Planctomycetota bacterium]|nr:phosphoribosylaminoimidazolesuccinocarboxamide synthase [Planctomycetota bacterium]